MCILIRYPMRLAGMVCKIVSLFLLVPLAYLVGGAIGTYEALFANIDASGSNSTASGIETANQIIQTAYRLHEAPEAFHRWGIVFAVCWAALALVIGVVMCTRFTYALGSELDEAGTPAPRRHRDESRSLRDEYELESQSAL